MTDCIHASECDVSKCPCIAYKQCGNCARLGEVVEELIHKLSEFACPHSQHIDECERDYNGAFDCVKCWTEYIEAKEQG